MGTFKVNIDVGDPQGRRYEAVEAVLGTGATYSTLPGPVLRRLGVPANRQVEFELADGRIVQHYVGQTRVRIDGQSNIVPVVFADEGSTTLLDAVTLEIF